MEILIKTAQFLLSLSILIILHELGHFIFAKLFKTRVEKFYLFFNPWFSIFKVKKGETEYGLGWLPLGGYVKISGMIDESMDKEQLKQPPQPYEFRSKPSWQRLLIMLGGVLVNFILALGIYSMILFAWGEEYLPNENAIYGYKVSELGKEIGFQDGDKIVSLDGEKVDYYRSIVPDILLNEVETVKVERDGKLIDIQISQSVISKLIKEENPIFIPRYPFVVDVVSEDTASVANKLNMQHGDQFVSFNGEEAMFYDQVKEKLQQNKGKEVSFSVKRDDDIIEYSAILPETGLLGVGLVSPDKYLKFKTLKYGFFESIPAGINKGFKTIQDYLKQFKLIFKPETKAYESLGGFLKIGSFFPETWDWQVFWNMTAFLSIILAVMNILPIPALDGGHVMFLLYEMISGRKPGDKFLEYAQLAGMIILLSLLVFANGNDIVQLIKK